jgi:hypothetical protein
MYILLVPFGVGERKLTSHAVTYALVFFTTKDCEAKGPTTNLFKMKSIYRRYLQMYSKLTQLKRTMEGI